MRLETRRALVCVCVLVCLGYTLTGGRENITYVIHYMPWSVCPPVLFVLVVVCGGGGRVFGGG